MATRRGLLIALASGALAAPLATFAQQKPAKVYRIGVLIPSNPAATAHAQEAFKQALREHGYVEGQNVIVERRYGEGRAERLSDLAAELERIKVDVIAVATDPAIAAVKQQTQTIPIVMVGSTDPVATGFVASLARPGGNVTGLSTLSPELSGKKLELLKEVVPGLSRVAIVWNPGVRGAVFDYKETESAARSLRLQLLSVEVSRAEDLDRAFSAVTNQRAQALIVPSPNPVLFSNRAQIVGFAQRNRLPSMYGQGEFADAGGLMSYGVSAAEGWRRAAAYVARILKGAKPADLPVEQPTKFELVINLKTAKAIGLTIPQALLLRADRVIE
ncbi:MAG: ABC transporter substrate-binding protein [Burkholderiales bacterium]